MIDGWNVPSESIAAEAVWISDQPLLANGLAIVFTGEPTSGSDQG
jgi:hypothetical protein